MDIMRAITRAQKLSEAYGSLTKPAILRTLEALDDWNEIQVKLVPDAIIARHPDLLREWSIGETYDALDRVTIAGSAYRALVASEGTEETCPVHAPKIWQKLE